MNVLESGFLANLMSVVHFAPIDGIVAGISRAGNGGLIWILMSVVLLCIKDLRKAGLAVSIALLSDLLVVNVVLKPLVERVRPYHVNPDIIPLIAYPKDYSFPSGHAAAAFAAATALYCFNKKWGSVALILAAVMSFSRLYLGVHYPTDVFIGAAIGALLGVLSAYIVRKVEKKVINK